MMVDYEKGFIENADAVFASLWNGLDWNRVENTPRREYYCNDVAVPYTYGRGAGVRTYQVQTWSPEILAIKRAVEAKIGVAFEVCFLNGYANSRDQLGWHADDSPEMDDARPIAIVSLGAEREIYFSPATDRSSITKLKLASGSLCVMPAGMQETHLHKIPKAGFECGPRVSLTFRGYAGT